MERGRTMYGSAVTASDRPSELLERSRALSALDDALATAIRSLRGRLVLIGGESGVGKTALLRRFCDERRASTRILWGSCDALFTPRPLGPLLDIAEAAGGELEELVQRSARPHEVAAALVGDLKRRKPTVVVFEDVHWADEATLDVLRLLGRKIEAVPTVVLASYRDDQLGRSHPLRILIGELATGEAVDRLKVESLSPAAVAKLAEPHGVDGDELYAKTEGNPFFVTEALAAGEDEIPQTVRDAVLARVARLSPAGRTLLEAVAVVPPQAELWLLEALAPDVVDRLDECLASGMLTYEPGGVAFRHELARLSVEESLPPDQKAGLHRKALGALASPSSGAPDIARLAHHAEAAGDVEAVLKYAPAAAERAAALGAHREAAAHYARALRFAEAVSPAERAQLLDRRAHECFLTDQNVEAVEALEEALDYHRQLGDRRKEGDSLRALAQNLWCPGRTTETEEAARRAVAVLESLPPGRELAMAYSNLASVCKDAENADEALAWGARATELAERLDDKETVVHALNTIGTVEFLAGLPAGREKLERSVELAAQAGLESHMARGFYHLAWAAVRQRMHAVSNRYLEAGLAYCSERGLELHRLYLLGYRARSELDQGRWTEAVDAAEQVLRVPRHSTVPRILALVALGLVRARRGDPGQWTPLDEAWALAEPSGELQRIGPAAAARAEAAWLEGRPDAVAEATGTALELALSRRVSWVIGELAYWRWRAGINEKIPPGTAEPYALQIRGDWAAAAELWTELGCPYEAALALADADDEDALRASLDELQRLGAQPAAAIVARRLRERGVRGVPRGPRPATRENPAGLTQRELEVLELVAQGLRNAEIAERLFLAEKTVDHHVSAILRKLDVRTRGEASAEAARLGLAAQDR
jgi:DNA-binding CsgD family transcriptional regulator/tetratricopeptide (TPR) repeat protein